MLGKVADRSRRNLVIFGGFCNVDGGVGSEGNELNKARSRKSDAACVLLTGGSVKLGPATGSGLGRVGLRAPRGLRREGSLQTGDRGGDGSEDKGGLVL